VLLYAGAIFFIEPTFQITAFFILRVEGSWSLWAGHLLAVVSGLGGHIAIGVAILRYRLYDIDLIINRTLVYGSLTTTLVGVYVGSVVVLQGLLRALTGQESQLAIVASTLAVAALLTLR
jgi:hypothetical protein